MQFCHGSPGVIPVLLRMYEITRDNIYMDAVMQSCDSIWKYGLLKKGVGLCHGISGNAIAILKIWKTLALAQVIQEIEFYN